MEQETDLDYIRRRLRETAGQHQRIALDAGVPQTTVSRIHNGAMPRLDTAQKLRDYLKRLEREKLTVERRGAVRRARAQRLAAPALGD